ncbi:MAG: hypothetical protein JST47_09375 [Bacteroidetes bacterium]|nr:hypothetical protein [Bacteroidota bacterium]MBS1973314.1 hypothetical protein [Bacteroidota bacterium]
MRKIATSLAFLSFSAGSLAQGAFSNSTSATLEKVIQDYPNRFKDIKGDVIIQNPQTTEYQSKVHVPGSSSCIVTHYSSSKNDVYSWGCTLLKTEDFNTAKNKFREIFNQIKNSIIKLNGNKPYILNGQYESPTEDKKFTTVIFELIPAVGEMKAVKINLSLQYLVTEWKLSLSVYDQAIKDSDQVIASGG